MATDSDIRFITVAVLIYPDTYFSQLFFISMFINRYIFFPTKYLTIILFSSHFSSLHRIVNRNTWPLHTTRSIACGLPIRLQISVVYYKVLMDTCKFEIANQFVSVPAISVKIWFTIVFFLHHALRKIITLLDMMISHKNNS